MCARHSTATQPTKTLVAINASKGPEYSSVFCLQMLLAKEQNLQRDTAEIAQRLQMPVHHVEEP